MSPYSKKLPLHFFWGSGGGAIGFGCKRDRAFGKGVTVGSGDTIE